MKLAEQFHKYLQQGEIPPEFLYEMTVRREIWYPDFVMKMLDFDESLISGLNNIHYPNDTDSFPYELSPFDSIKDLIQCNRFSSDDVFYDFGSGAGFVAMFFHLCTGAQARGIEIQENLYQESNRIACNLNIEDQVSFQCGDALEADFSDANVFYFFNPFAGDTMSKIIDKLHELSKTKDIIIYNAGYNSHFDKLDQLFHNDRMNPRIHRSI